MDKKPETMLEMLNEAKDSLTKQIVNTWETVSKMHPDIDIGLRVRLFHMATVRALSEEPSSIWRFALGVIAMTLTERLTEEELIDLATDNINPKE